MTKPTLGALIRAARQEKGLSLRALAARCGMQSSHLCELEAEHYQPSEKLVSLLALHLDLDRDAALLAGDIVPPDVATKLKENPEWCEALRRLPGGAELTAEAFP